MAHSRSDAPDPGRLLTLAAAFGSVGALFGMYTFRHKTRKPKFAYGVPALLVVHLALFYWLFL